MPRRYYHLNLKDGRRRRRVHDSKTGRIIEWVDAEDLDEPEGQFKIVEWTMHFIPTRDSRPSSLRNWEVRLRLAEGHDEDDIEEYAREIMLDYFNEPMLDTSEFGFDKKGEDFIGWDEYDDKIYKIVDTARPQYRYPRDRWGDYHE